MNNQISEMTMVMATEKVVYLKLSTVEGNHGAKAEFEYRATNNGYAVYLDGVMIAEKCIPLIDMKGFELEHVVWEN